MDRRYYLAKFAVVVFAVGLAFASSGLGGKGAARGIHAMPNYSAPAQMQDATWRAAGSAARLMVCAASRALRNLADIAP